MIIVLRVALSVIINTIEQANKRHYQQFDVLQVSFIIPNFFSIPQHHEPIIDNLKKSRGKGQKPSLSNCVDIVLVALTIWKR